MKEVRVAPGPPAAVALGLLLGLALVPGPARADTVMQELARSTSAAIQEVLGPEVERDPSIPDPDRFFGFPTGTKHLRPDQITAYLETVAESSARVRFEIQGTTREGRPQPLLAISSSANLERSDEIREAKRRLAEEGDSGRGDVPVVVWLMYSIHGNEASGANAAPWVVYHLASATGPEIDELLDRAVVLVDPMQNPDGIARFAHWVNTHRGRVPVADPRSREHVEPWPSGRTNHYWFDLNRDWLPLVHPESRNRVETFHRWLPDVVGDFHEMRRGSTYFFQPGVPERTNPLTPEANQRITARLAEGHASALDRIGTLFFTREVYDDYYYGKGSTYPDILGAVGILYEQSSVEGLRLEHDGVVATFGQAIANQLATSLSTIRGAVDHRKELVEFRVDFASLARKRAADSGFEAWVCRGDRDRMVSFVESLRGHGIRVDAGTDGAAVISVDQPRYPLLEALFEQRSEFPASTFYDVSTWTFPLAFGVDCRESRRDPELAGSWSPGVGRIVAGEEPVAFLVSWDQGSAPAATAALFARGLRLRALAKGTTIEDPSGPVALPPGTLVAVVSEQTTAKSDIEGIVEEVAASSGTVIRTAPSALTVSGIDLGSPRAPRIEAPKPAVVIGRGVSTYGAGTLWHALDHRFGLPTTLLERRLLAEVDLGPSTHLLFPDGDWSDLSDEAVDAVVAWVKAGGVLVGVGSGAEWAWSRILDRDGEEVEASEAEDESPEGGELRDVPYGDYPARRAAELLSGTIAAVAVDRTHPLAFGVPGDPVAVFRTDERVFSEPENPWEVVARYRSGDPILSGWASETNRGRLAGTPAVTATRLGEGVVIRFADDPVFRGFWRGSEGFLANAIFLAGLVEETSPPSTWHGD